MRNRIGVALLATTALTPQPAHAGPVLAFVAGALNAVFGVAGGILATTGAVGAWSAGFGLGSFLTSTLVGRTLLSFGLSALAQSFQNTPSPPSPAAQMGNFAQPISYAQWVFGRTRKGGPIAFTAAANSRRYYAVIVAAHPIEGIVQHWLDEYTAGVDDTVTDFDTANLLTTGDSGTYSAPDALANRGRIEPFLGGDGQTANAGLVATFDEWTEAHDFAGLAGAVLWAQKTAPQDFQSVYPRGQQWAWTPVIDGLNAIYDPRDGGYRWTNNAALCLAYWITEILGQRVDWDEVAIEADVCDQQVLNADGETIARWTINGTLDDDLSFEAQRAQMAGACDAFLYERPDGKVGFKVGRYIDPQVTLEADDFFVLEVIEGQQGADAPSEISVTYVEPDNAWRETPSGVWVEDDTARRVRDEPQLYLVTAHNQAARLAKRIARARRPHQQMSGTIGPLGYELIGQRFFRINHPGMQVDDVFEIGTLRRTGVAMFEIEAVSVDPEDFDFDAGTEEPTRPVYSDVVSGLESDAITNVAAVASDGPSITASWDAQPDYLWQQVRWRALAASQWQSATISTDATEYIITGLLDGTIYEVQARNVGAALLSNPSDWETDPAIQVTTIGDSTAPAALAGFTTSATLSDVTITVTAANDPQHFGTIIYRGTDAVFANAAALATVYGDAGSVKTYDDTGLAAGTYYYWAEPINASGVSGPASGPQSETIT